MLRLIFTIIFLAILIYIINNTVDINELKQILIEFPKLQLLGFLLLASFLTLLKVYRFLILLNYSGIDASFWETLKAFVASQAVTPLPGGETARGILIHKETGAHLHQTTAPVITQAFLDIASAALLTLFGSLVFQKLRVPSLIAMSIIVLITIGLTQENIIIFFQKHLSRFKFLTKVLSRSLSFQKDFSKYLLDPSKTLFRTLGVSLLINITGGFLIYFIALSLDIKIDFLHSLFIYSSGIVISSLAGFIPGGLGVTEGGLTGILLLFSVELPKALVLVLLFRLSTLVFSVFMGLSFLMIFYSRELLVKYLPFIKKG